MPNPREAARAARRPTFAEWWSAAYDGQQGEEHGPDAQLLKDWCKSAYRAGYAAGKAKAAAIRARGK